VYRQPEARGHLTTATDIGLGHCHREFISTDSRAKVGCANDSLQLLTNKAQSRVAAAMATAVVDPLQIVEVDHHQRQAAFVTFSERNLTLHEPFELATIRKAC
jgi:hypothetical protein